MPTSQGETTTPGGQVVKFIYTRLKPEEHYHGLHRGLNPITRRPQCNLGGNRSVDEIGLFSTNPQHSIEEIDTDLHR